jgi:hypothetical protein
MLGGPLFLLAKGAGGVRVPLRATPSSDFLVEFLREADTLYRVELRRVSSPGSRVGDVR